MFQSISSTSFENNFTNENIIQASSYYEFGQSGDYMRITITGQTDVTVLYSDLIRKYSKKRVKHRIIYE